MQIKTSACDMNKQIYGQHLLKLISGAFGVICNFIVFGAKSNRNKNFDV